jgi:hypothetical protein
MPARAGSPRSPDEITDRVHKISVECASNVPELFLRLSDFVSNSQLESFDAPNKFYRALIFGIDRQSQSVLRLHAEARGIPLAAGCQRIPEAGKATRSSFNIVPTQNKKPVYELRTGCS